MALKLKVTYLDGREETVVVPPKVHVMTERHYAGLTEARAIELSYYMAWLSLHRAGKEPAEFEPFLDLIEEVEQVEGGKPEDPTAPAQPPDESSV